MATDGLARSDQVAVLAPTGRDGMLAERVLSMWGIRAEVHRDMASICATIRSGVGVVVLAEEALTSAPRAELLAELEAQPSWSDVPIIVLTQEGELSRVMARGVEVVALRANVTLLERPVRVATFVTALRSALRARDRQYDLREHLHALDVARAEAEHANRAKMEFLAMMSHELRTPLNAIGGYADLMELGVRGPITEEQRSDLARIQKSQRHLLTLINGVLTFARIETGNVNYDLVNVPLKEMLTLAESLILPQVQRRSLQLDVQDCDVDLRVHADRDKAQQILLNLLTNSVKFTPAGGKITVCCDSTPNQVSIHVMDTGVGIPAEKFETIFDPFVQLDARLTRSQEGVGLGLAISRDLARGMGGDLLLASEVGKGSTFTLVLPRAK